MTHIQNLFIKNLRFHRSRRGFSQIAFALEINVSPNYLNAIENGKNFPSLDVLQKIVDVLGIFPYELFLENPETANNASDTETIRLVTSLKQQTIQVFDEFLESRLGRKVYTD